MREPCKPNKTPINLPEVGDVFVQGIGMVDHTEYIMRMGGNRSLDGEDLELSTDVATESYKVLCDMAYKMVVDKNDDQIWFADAWSIWMNKYPDDRERLIEALSTAAGFRIEEAKKD